jgi:hypothetical protein
MFFIIVIQSATCVRVFTEDLFDKWISSKSLNESAIQIGSECNIILRDEKKRPISLYYINIQRVKVEVFAGGREENHWMYSNDFYSLELEIWKRKWYKYSPHWECTTIL